MTISFNMEWRHPETVWFLHRGGRTPLAIADPAIVLVDRNIVSHARRLMNVRTASAVGPDWWLSFLNKPTCTLNPVLAASEGSERRPPTLHEFLGSVDTISEVLRSAFPLAEVAAFQEYDLERVYSTMRQMSQYDLAFSDFLVNLAPRIAHRPPQGKERDLEDEVYEVAARFGVTGDSLVLLAVLSCVYERKDGQPPQLGRGLLKPCPGYTEANAYNALADITSLNALSAFSLLPAHMGLVTQDRALCDFWCALGVRMPVSLTAPKRRTATPSQALFPALSTEEVLALFDRLRAALPVARRPLEESGPAEWIGPEAGTE